MRRARFQILYALAVCLAFAATGIAAAPVLTPPGGGWTERFLSAVIEALDNRPLSMGLSTPEPVPPWVTERVEEKFAGKNPFNTPLLPPLKEGAPLPTCEDPPDEARILRALPKVARGVPYLYQERRDDVQVVTELIKDTIDPPRFFPMVGMAHLHHCHWKCTVYYRETVESGYPFPYRCVRDRVEVVYLDLDHLHLCTGK